MNFTELPTDLPKPQDDGGCKHLEGAMMPAISLAATAGSPIPLNPVDLSTCSGTTLVYIYPLTGQPGVALPTGWDAIPGARGCTPQSCSFRDHKSELEALGIDRIFGLSVQTSDYQAELVKRLHLPFALLSDSDYALTDALPLPSFSADGARLLKRAVLIITKGRIQKVFYPVFPPDQSAAQVIAWLQTQYCQD